MGYIPMDGNGCAMTPVVSNMESKSQPSAAVVQELLDSMKGLYKSEKGWDMILTSTYEDIEYKYKAHTAIICPRSEFFMELFEYDNKINNEDESDARIHKWVLAEWRLSAFAKMLQYFYELDYQVDSQDGTAPELSIHAELWWMGETYGIKGLKAMALDKFKMALSQFNSYGSELGFTMSYLENLLTAMEDVWRWNPPSPSTNVPRNQLSMHIQRNIKEWAKMEGSQSRSLESTYRLIFREIEQDEQDFTAMKSSIKANYLKYLDTESGHEALGADRKDLVSNNM